LKVRSYGSNDKRQAPIVENWTGVHSDFLTCVNGNGEKESGAR
jgi:hypothetical protein